MAGATSAPWGGAPRCCAAPQGPTHPAGLLRERVWLPCPCLRIPCALLHLHRRRLLLRAPSQPWARWQPALPAPHSPSLHPARALPPAEKLPNLPFQSAALGTHARKANTDGKPRRSPTPLPPALWPRARALPGWQRQVFLQSGINPYLEDSEGRQLVVPADLCLFFGAGFAPGLQQSREEQSRRIYCSWSNLSPVERQQDKSVLAPSIKWE